MGNSNYRRGADFEREVQDYLEAKGWFAIRAAGSHGLVDVLAIDREGYVYLIQCKTGKAKMSKSQYAELLGLGIEFNAKAFEVNPSNYKEIL